MASIICDNDLLNISVQEYKDLSLEEKFGINIDDFIKMKETKLQTISIANIIASIIGNLEKITMLYKLMDNFKTFNNDDNKSALLLLRRQENYKTISQRILINKYNNKFECFIITKTDKNELKIISVKDLSEIVNEFYKEDVVFNSYAFVDACFLLYKENKYETNIC